MSDQVTSDKTYLPTYDGCFVCGQPHESGICTRFWAGEGGVVHGVFAPKQSHTGFLNVVHGGIISAFLDELMGWPICLANERVAFTGQMTIRFKNQVFAGNTYIGTAQPGVQPEGKPYWEGKGELRDEDGKLYAEGTGRYFLIPPAQTKAFGAAMTYQPNDLPVFREPLGDK